MPNDLALETSIIVDVDDTESTCRQASFDEQVVFVGIGDVQSPVGTCSLQAVPRTGRKRIAVDQKLPADSYQFSSEVVCGVWRGIFTQSEQIETIILHKMLHLSCTVTEPKLGKGRIRVGQDSFALTIVRQA